MSINKYLPHFFFINLLWGLFTPNLNAQTYETTDEISALKATIIKMDSLFWVSYNTCDMENFQTFLIDDLEFYHDKSGLLETAEGLITAMESGLCKTGENQIFRAAVTQSVEVFPLNNYGAIISGEHTFSKKDNGKILPPSGIAKFTQLWILEKNTWKMSRVLSYNHQPFIAESN